MTSTGCVSCGNEATSDFEALREDFYGDLMCPQCYDEDAEEKYNNEAREQYGIEIYQEDEDELFKVAKGDYDTISYFKTLEEAKAEVDKMRATHDFDYGYIMRVRGIYEDQYTVKDEVEVGYWGQYAKDWEDEEDEEDEQIAFDCHTCGRGVVRDSEEHDHSGCDQDNDDNWYCRKCYKDFVYKFRLIKKWCGPECDTKNCEGYAAKNIHWPISKGGEFWTLCNVCYEIDQDDGQLKIPRGYTRDINGKLKRKKIKIIFN